MGARTSEKGATLYVFVVNGLLKEVRETELKRHPGCYEVMPAEVKAAIVANRKWLSKL
jgi:hypothetical protein